MKRGIAKAFYGFLLSFVLASPLTTIAQSPVNFDIDVSVSSYKIIKTLPLPGNKVAMLIGTPSYSNVYLWVYNSSGTRITNVDITSLITWPSLPRLSTEFNAIVTNNGNIFITFTASDSDDKLTDNARFIIINESGALQTSGQVNSTDPGTILTRTIQLAKLSDGKVVAAFQRTDNATHAFRIFNENGTAFTANDIVYAGPGTANASGAEVVWDSRIGVFKNGNFMISFFFFDAPLKAVLFDNSGNTILVGGQGSFEIDGMEPEYTNYANVTLANGNVAAFWRLNSTSYFKIINNTGATVQGQQVIAGGRNLGNFISENTSGAEGFIVTEYTLQDPGDPWGNPYISYEVKKYNQTGVLQSTTALQGDLIQPTYYFVHGASGGYAYSYSYYKSFILSDGEYSITSDNDVKGTMAGFSMSTLPVNLISYTASLLSNQKVQLNWSTASESNSKNFEIEKSFDGVNFVSIGSVAAAGNSTVVTSYIFTDPEILSQKSLYRLKQVDLDGKVKDLGLRIVKPGKTAASISVYPNPLIGNIMTINTGDERLPVTYRINDTQGRVMKTGTLLQSQQQIDVQELPVGIYFLQIGNEVIKIKK
jgi:hypothetical protein